MAVLQLHRPSVGFCGLGAMGGGMAKHLLKREFSVTGYDVYKPLVHALEDAGGKAASTPKEAASNSEILVIMVTSYIQVTSVLFDPDSGAIHGLPSDACIIVSSTVPPHFCEGIRKRLDEEFRRSDIHLLDCPVSGGTPKAADGTLSIFSSGPDVGLKKVRPVLEALSSKLYHIPGGIGFGSKAKMCHQVLPEVDIALCAEVMALAAMAGLNTQEVFDLVQTSSGSSWIVGNRVPHMLDGDQTIYSAIPNSQKDSSIITTTAAEISFPVHLVATAQQVYQAGIHRDWAKDDDSTLWRLYAPGQPKDLVHQQTHASAVRRSDLIASADIIDIFTGAHLAASAEAMGFTQAIGLDTKIMYDIISGAAGSNAQFVQCVPEMKAPKWTLQDVTSAREVGAKLARALHKANSTGSSLPIASAALQMFYLHLGAL